jgi:hypothetical protein
MSQVTLEGNASGTGIFTVAAPNSNTNRTLTLPDATGTVVTTDATQTLTNKSISGAQINSGTVAVARLGSGSPSASNFLRGDGSWQAVSGGVTSLNGATGAITNTDLNVIGSWVGSSKRINQAVNNTVAGNTLTYAYWDGSSWNQPSLGLTGTWRFVGGVRHASADSVNDCASIWVRVS